MTIKRFLQYICYSTINPGIHQGRWQGMLKWAVIQGYMK